METEYTPNLPLPVQIKTHLDASIVGQENYKKALAMATYKYIEFGVTDPLLVIGPSGSGKTFTIEQLKKCRSLPISVMTWDVSRLTPSGYQGDSISDLFNAWKMVCFREKTKRGIIYLDEVDKIFTPNIDASGENINAAVQLQVMNCLEGIKCEGVDTSNILFVLGGAFTGLEKIERKQSNIIGFTKETTHYALEQNTLRENLRKFGIEKEMLGRISKIVRLSSLNTAQLETILLHPTKGVLAAKKREFQRQHLSFVIEKDVINWIVEKVVQEDLGARSVKNIVEEIFGDYDYEMLDKGYDKMKITMDVVRGEKPIFLKEKYMSIPSV